MPARGAGSGQRQATSARRLMPAEGSDAGSRRDGSKPWTWWSSAGGVPNRITVGSESHAIAALCPAARTTDSAAGRERSATRDRTRSTRPAATAAATTRARAPTLIGEARLRRDHGQDQARGMAGRMVDGDAVGPGVRGPDLRRAGLEVAREVGEEGAAHQQPQPVALAERVARHQVLEADR